jgi:hypothetical protein
MLIICLPIQGVGLAKGNEDAEPSPEPESVTADSTEVTVDSTEYTADETI